MLAIFPRLVSFCKCKRLLYDFGRYNAARYLMRQKQNGKQNSNVAKQRGIK
ncbi:hypothetical protein HMPREF1572_01439 [Gardnerella vaginalis JCP7275]|nr:hypothetical protein HMPREF1572_01439 [Gardnerella vaginalis JCP7275]